MIPPIIIDNIVWTLIHYDKIIAELFFPHSYDQANESSYAS